MALEKTDTHPLVIIQSLPLNWRFLVSALENQQIPPRYPKVISNCYSRISLVVQWLGLHASRGWEKEANQCEVRGPRARAQ